MSRRKAVHIGRGATLRLRGECWYLDYNFKGQRSKRSLFTSDRDSAEIIARELISDSQSRSWGVPIPRDVLLGDFRHDYEEYSKLHHAPKTQVLHRTVLVRFEEFLREAHGAGRSLLLSDITRTDVEGFQAAEAARIREIGPDKKIKKARNATVNIYLRALAAFLALAVERSLLRKNPAAGIKPLGKQDDGYRTLTTDQVMNLLREAAKKVHGSGPGGKGAYSRPRTTPVFRLVRLILNTGLRLGEALFLEWTDIDWKRRILRVPFTEQYKPKDRERRVVGLNDVAFADLRKSFRRRSGDVPWVFANKEGKAFDRDNTRRELKRIAARAGVSRVTFKILRATFATAAAEVMPPFKLQRIMGHSSVRTTEQHYIHLRGAGDWIPPIVGLKKRTKKRLRRIENPARKASLYAERKTAISG